MPPFVPLPLLFHPLPSPPPPLPLLPLTSHFPPLLHPPACPSPTLTPPLPLPYSPPPTPSPPLLLLPPPFYSPSPLPSPPPPLLAPQLPIQILFDDKLKMNLTTELKEGDLPEQLADDLVTNRLVNEESGLCASGTRGGHGRVGTCVNLPTLYHCL